MTADNFQSMLTAMTYRTFNKLRETHELNGVPNERLEQIAADYFQEVKHIFYKDETIQP